MFARVATYTGDADELVKGFQGATDELEQIPGFSSAYFCVNRADGKGLTITLWETEEALQTSAEQANKLRSEATEPSGASIDSVTHFEVAVTAGQAAAAA